MHEIAKTNFIRNFCGEGRGATPARLGTRFDETGQFLVEPGNTVVSHVVPGSATEAAIIKVRDGLRALDPGNHFAWTPVSSYHMTLFQGVIEYRRQSGYWPTDLPLDASISQSTDYFLARLQDIPQIAPFKVKLEEITPHGLTVSPATDVDAAIIAGFRDTLADRFGYRHPDHDTYVLHITVAYIVRWLPQASHETYLPALQALAETFRKDVPVIELGPADFCTFDDMNHFEPVFSFR
ncbi:MAG: DUF1868 domain-containing protein [Alphaproteobacteria bacterium]|nr:DUF1868 domain-containing protein [Alphaproteobacteria bacterium]